MNTTWKNAIWSQFGAAIDMLGNAIRACPDDLWSDSTQPTLFWYVAYHALFYLDLYLSGEIEGFTPPAPFTLDELDPAGVLPPRVYTRDELLTYLRHGRAKCQATIEALTADQAYILCRFPWGEMTFLELLLYNMRHVQEHAAQLNLILGTKLDSAPHRVGKAGPEESGPAA